MKRTISILFVLLLAGCTPRAPVARDQAVVLHEPRGCVITILLDMSGSFEEKMIDQGKAYEFCLATIDAYFRDRIGEKDELIIAQISGADRALLWQGTPMQLRMDFASPTDLSTFLRSKANSGQSNVFDNMAKSIEYLSSDPDVVSGKAKSAVLVLSDMLDNDPNQYAARERLKRALAEYGKRDGIVGCYFVDQTVVPSCRTFIADTGIRNFIVQAEIVGNPQLPVID